MCAEADADDDADDDDDYDEDSKEEKYRCSHLGRQVHRSVGGQNCRAENIWMLIALWLRYLVILFLALMSHLSIRGNFFRFSLGLIQPNNYQCTRPKPSLFI